MVYSLYTVAMNPSSNEISLPPPPQEQLPASGELNEAAIPQAEKATVKAEKGQLLSTATAPIILPLPTITDAPVQNSGVITTTQNVVQDVQDDGDLIEKEWVTKAKQIVEANREDPYKQSEEITVFRADYMQKRYNKTIKVSK